MVQAVEDAEYSSEKHLGVSEWGSRLELEVRALLPLEENTLSLYLL